MRKSLILLIITFLLMISNNTFAQWAGSGTVGDPYIINTKAHLDSLSTRVNSGTTYSGIYFKMTANINMSGSYTPIGNDTTKSFRGNFNGDGFQIRIAKITTPNNFRSGLFGQTNNATIQNVSMVVDSIYITGVRDDNFSGLLIAFADNTIVNNCNIGDSTNIYFSNLKKRNIVGGMVGYAYNSTFNFSYSLCSMTIYPQGDQNDNSIGGLIGKAVNCTINNCYTRNDIITGIENNNSYIGGLVGISQGSSFSNSYSAPNSLNSGFLFTGVIVSDTSASDSTTFDNCYYLIDTAVHAGSYVGTGLTIDQMLDDSFIDSLNSGQNPPVWDFDGGLPTIFPPIIWPGGGNGTESDPFKVKYVIDLINISEITKIRSFRNYFLRLENDINFNNGIIDSSCLYKPIGNFYNNKPFRGNFNGSMYAITNFSFSNPDSNNIGIFGYTKKATIKKIGITNINIIAKDTVGGLIAITDTDNIIDSCFVYGYIKGRNSIGGLVGVSLPSNSRINNSFSNVCIDAQTNVGGIAGNYKGAIMNAYSNSEIYSSINANNYVGGIIGLAKDTSTLINVYSASKIIRNGTNPNFGKIKGNNLGTNTNCYSRDSIFVNYTNINPSGYNGTQKSNLELRDSGFVAMLNNLIWRSDYTDNINDGYPIFTYQSQAVSPISSCVWPNTTASSVVIIKNGVQLKVDTSNSPKCAYIKIEKGGELNNTTNLNLFGEYNNELYVGKWNLIGLSTYSKNLVSLTNFTDTTYKTFVKRFDSLTNNWSTITTQDINTQFKFGEGILVMPNYSLDANLSLTSRIVSKGILYNNASLYYTFSNTTTQNFVSLSNNYPASLNVATCIANANNNPLILGGLVYVYDADDSKWNNNLQTTLPINAIKPSEGFFIAASSASGTFKFNKNQINNSSGAKNTIKSDLIYINAKANNEQREAFLEFNYEADNEFDLHDGIMLFGSNFNAVEPYFRSTTQQHNNTTSQLIKDAFSSLPYTTELDLRSQNSNEVILNFSNIPSDIHVYLIDSLSNHAQYLNEKPNYDLQINTGDNKNRLYILFSYNKEDINRFFKPKIAQVIRMWNCNNILYVEGENLIRYEIYDIIGNKILAEEILNDSYQKQLSLSQGIYTVKAHSKTSVKTKKISIR